MTRLICVHTTSLKSKISQNTFTIFRYEIPSRKTVTSRLEKKKAEMTLKVKNEMKSLDDIAITHDGWTSANTESYR